LHWFGNLKKGTVIIDAINFIMQSFSSPTQKICLTLSCISLVWGCATPTNAAEYYVNINGSDNGNGSKLSPWKTVNKALNSVPPNQGHIIKIGGGTFEIGKQVSVPSGIKLLGSGIDKTTILGELKLEQVKNITVGNIKLSGKKYNYELGLYIRDAENLLIRDLVFNAYANTAIDVQRVTNGHIYNINITDSSYNQRKNGQGNQQTYAIAIADLTNFAFHDISIDTRKRGGAGIKTVKDSWPKKQPWTAKPTILKNVRFYNLDIKVDKWNAWGNGWTPQIAIELWHQQCYECEIYNSTFNSTVSLAAIYTSDKTKIRVHHNLWESPDNPFYACEVASDNIEFHHNHIRGGTYPIALFGAKYKNLNVHHNLFENTNGPVLIGLFGGKMENFKFINNTVIINNSKNPLFRFKHKSAVQPQIRNNIFYNSSGKINQNLGISSNDLENNLFFNILAVGNRAMNFDPKFTLTGNKPFPYYLPQKLRKAVNLGAINSSTSDWKVGKPVK
jgi:hypothetical protein